MVATQEPPRPSSVALLFLFPPLSVLYRLLQLLCGLDADLLAGLHIQVLSKIPASLVKAYHLLGADSIKDTTEAAKERDLVGFIEQKT